MIAEIVSALILVCIGIIFLNPGHLSMPETVHSMLILAMIIGYISFAAFIFKEKAQDERETFHILSASRISYLIGIGTLIVAIAIQASQHNIDSWLIFTLCLMVLSKLFSRMYSRIRM